MILKLIKDLRIFKIWEFLLREFEVFKWGYFYHGDREFFGFWDFYPEYWEFLSQIYVDFFEYRHFDPKNWGFFQIWGFFKWDFFISGNFYSGYRDFFTPEDLYPHKSGFLSRISGNFYLDDGDLRIWILKYGAFIPKIEEFHTLESGILENPGIFISKFSGILFILSFFLYFIIIY